MRVGVLGGTFDPIHYGHLVMAEEALVRLALSKVIFVPAKDPPHKPPQSYSPAEQRLRMVRLGVAGNPAFEVSEAELKRLGPSYTVDTLAFLQEQLGPGAELFFVMGMDSLANIMTWHRPADIVTRAHLAVAARPGHVVDLPGLERMLPGVSARLHVLHTPHIGISGHDLRWRVAKGLPIRYQLPASVEAYIYEHGLYRDSGDTASGEQGALCP